MTDSSETFRPPINYRVLTKNGSSVDLATRDGDIAWVYLFGHTDGFQPDQVPPSFCLNTLLISDVSEQFARWLDATHPATSAPILPFLRTGADGFWPTLTTDPALPSFDTWGGSLSQGQAWHAQDWGAAAKRIADEYKRQFGDITDEFYFRYPWLKMPSRITNTIRKPEPEREPDTGEDTAA